jgi:hypothetical protein
VCVCVCVCVSIYSVLLQYIPMIQFNIEVRYSEIKNNNKVEQVYLKLMKFISGIFHLILSDCSWPQVLGPQKVKP